MPSGHSVRLDDDEDVLPSRPNPRQQHPEASVGWRYSRAVSLLGERCELLTQGELDDRLLASAPEKGRDTAKGDRRELEQLVHFEAHSAWRHDAMRD